MSATILLVDDDRLIRLLARKALEGIGFRVVEADTGEAGVAFAAAETPSLVLLDFHLPDFDAPAVAARLRALPNFAATPILLLSGAEDAAEIDAARAAGCDDHVPKPINARALAERVRAELARVPV